MVGGPGPLSSRLMTLLQWYDHCGQYIPKSDTDRYISCDNQQTCVDACNARKGKCDKAVADGVAFIYCMKLVGNLRSYCMGFETVCKAATPISVR